MHGSPLEVIHAHEQVGVGRNRQLTQHVRHDSNRELARSTGATGVIGETNLTRRRHAGDSMRECPSEQHPLVPEPSATGFTVHAGPQRLPSRIARITSAPAAQPFSGRGGGCAQGTARRSPIELQTRFERRLQLGPGIRVEIVSGKGVWAAPS